MACPVLRGEGAAHPDVAFPLKVQKSEIRIAQSDAAADRFDVKRLHVVLTRVHHWDKRLSQSVVSDEPIVAASF
jgi:hypothetical protein